MTRLALPMVLVCSLIVNACSSDKGTSPTDASTTDVSPDTAGTADAGGVKVTVSGSAAPHPLTAVFEPDGGTEFSMLAVAVVDPLTVLSRPTDPPLAVGPLTISPANCSAAAGCGWSFDNVDISGIMIGLVGIVDDLRTPATSRLWLKTGTGAGSGDYIASIRANPMPITDRRLFAVSKRTEAILATFAGRFVPDTAIVPGSLETRGFMIGTVIGRLSGGITPVAGAMVSVPPTETRVNILYPNDMFDGVGTSTAAHGTFLVVPKNGTPPLRSVVSSWTITPPAGSTMTWTSFMAGSTPGTCFVILFPADE